ncbi:MAG: ribonuclease HII [Candidatus Heteroscillospira sp.]
MDLWSIEREYARRGFERICGCDEAGAGPLAGPVYAAAVILPPETEIEGLNDSKKLTAKKRERIFDEIVEKAAAWAVESVSAEDIDGINILNARMLAMRLAVEKLEIRPDFLLIDGNCDRGFTMPREMVVGGDGLSANIAAASILAKVSRDRRMRELDELYPGYGFGKHMGYGTKAHYEALDRLGPCPEHRQSFLRKYYARREH